MSEWMTEAYFNHVLFACNLSAALRWWHFWELCHILILHEIQSSSVKMIQKCLRELICVDAELHLHHLEFFLKLFLVQQHPTDRQNAGQREPATQNDNGKPTAMACFKVQRTQSSQVLRFQTRVPQQHASLPLKPCTPWGMRFLGLCFFITK